MNLEPHDEARLELILRSYSPVFRERRGDSAAIERAWGVPLPPSFCGLIDRVDGGTLKGGGGVMEIWPTRSNLMLWREDYRAIKSTLGARVAFFASDGGSFECFFDVDNYFGRGHYAVLAADCASDVTELMAPTFYAALERVIAGPLRRPETDEIPRPRPPGSQRV